MNKYQSALDSLMLQVIHVKSDYIKSGEAKADIDLLQYLVDKAKPKRLKDTERKRDYGYCPICGHYNEHLVNYCHNCGQALDWSKEDEES